MSVVPPSITESDIPNDLKTFIQDLEQPLLELSSRSTAFTQDIEKIFKPCSLDWSRVSLLKILHLNSPKIPALRYALCTIRDNTTKKVERLCIDFITVIFAPNFHDIIISFISTENHPKFQLNTTSALPLFVATTPTLPQLDNNNSVMNSLNSESSAMNALVISDDNYTDKYCVIVRGLHPASSSGLSKIFRDLPIASTHIPEGFNHSDTDYGFVAFKTAAEARQALRTAKKNPLLCAEYKYNFMSDKDPARDLYLKPGAYVDEESRQDLQNSFLAFLNQITNCSQVVITKKGSWVTFKTMKDVNKILQEGEFVFPDGNKYRFYQKNWYRPILDPTEVGIVQLPPHIISNAANMVTTIQNLGFKGITKHETHNQTLFIVFEDEEVAQEFVSKPIKFGTQVSPILNKDFTRNLVRNAKNQWVTKAMLENQSLLQDSRDNRKNLQDIRDKGQALANSQHHIQSELNLFRNQLQQGQAQLTQLGQQFNDAFACTQQQLSLMAQDLTHTRKIQTQAVILQAKHFSLQNDLEQNKRPLLDDVADVKDILKDLEKQRIAMRIANQTNNPAYAEIEATIMEKKRELQILKTEISDLDQKYRNEVNKGFQDQLTTLAQTPAIDFSPSSIQHMSTPSITLPVSPAPAQNPPDARDNQVIEFDSSSEPEDATSSPPKKLHRADPNTLDSPKSLDSLPNKAPSPDPSTSKALPNQDPLPTSVVTSNTNILQTESDPLVSTPLASPMGKGQRKRTPRRPHNPKTDTPPTAEPPAKTEPPAKSTPSSSPYKSPGRPKKEKKSALPAKIVPPKEQGKKSEASKMADIVSAAKASTIGQNNPNASKNTRSNNSGNITTINHHYVVFPLLLLFHLTNPLTSKWITNLLILCLLPRPWNLLQLISFLPMCLAMEFEPHTDPPDITHFLILGLINIHGLVSKRHNLSLKAFELQQWITTRCIDVCAVVETHWKDISEAPPIEGYKWIASTSNDRTRGTALLVRNSIALTQFPPANTPTSIKGRFTTGFLKFANSDLTIQISAIYAPCNVPDTISEDFYKAIDTQLDPNTPQITLGDFNAVLNHRIGPNTSKHHQPNSPFQLWTARTNLSDISTSNPEDPHPHSFASLQHKHNLIDYILCDPTLSANGFVDYVTAPSSDHNGIVGLIDISKFNSVTIQRTPPEKFTHIYFDRSNQEHIAKFHKAVDKYCHSHWLDGIALHQVTRELLEEAPERIDEALEHMYQICRQIPSDHFQIKTKNTCSPEMEELLKLIAWTRRAIRGINYLMQVQAGAPKNQYKINHINQLLQQNLNPLLPTINISLNNSTATLIHASTTLSTACKDLWKDFHALQAELQTDTRANFVNNINKEYAKNSKQFRRMYYRRTHTNQGLNLIWDGTKWVTDTQEIQECCAKYFEELGTEAPNPASTWTQSDRLIENLNTPKTLLLQKISRDHFDNVIKNLHVTAPGPDKISNSILKSLPTSGLDLLYNLVMGMIDAKYVPTELMTGHIILLHKSGEKHLLSNYRGITLLNTIYKIITALLKEVLVEATIHLVSQAHAGAVPGRGLHSKALLMDIIINHANRVKKDLFIFLADLSKAYDKISMRALRDALLFHGADPEFTQFYLYLIKSGLITVKLPTGTSRWFQLFRGIKQGCGLSPYIFVLFMNLFVMKLEETARGYSMEMDPEIQLESPLDAMTILIQALAFLDDLTLITDEDKHMKENIELFINFLTHYCMQLNTDKSQVIKWGPNPDFTFSTPSSAGVLKSPDYPIFRLLGFWYHPSGNPLVTWQVMSEKLQNQANNIAKGMFSSAFRAGLIRTDMECTFRFFAPLLGCDYSPYSFHHEQKSFLTQVLKSFGAHRISHLRATIPASLGGLNFRNWEHIAAASCCKLWTDALSSADDTLKYAALLTITAYLRKQGYYMREFPAPYKHRRKPLYFPISLTALDKTFTDTSCSFQLKDPVLDLPLHRIKWATIFQVFPNTGTPASRALLISSDLTIAHTLNCLPNNPANTANLLNHLHDRPLSVLTPRAKQRLQINRHNKRFVVQTLQAIIRRMHTHHYLFDTPHPVDLSAHLPTWPEQHPLIVATDGSKSNIGTGGAAVVHSETLNTAYKIEEEPTPLRCELLAILLAIILTRNWSTIQIFSDCATAITLVRKHVLQRIPVRSATPHSAILKAMQSRPEASPARLQLLKVKAHKKRIETYEEALNALADNSAKEAANSGPIFPLHILHSHLSIRLVHLDRVYDSNPSPLIHRLLLEPHIKAYKDKYLINNNVWIETSHQMLQKWRLQYSHMFNFVIRASTGHWMTLDKVASFQPDPLDDWNICPQCDSWSPETSTHFWLECPILNFAKDSLITNCIQDCPWPSIHEDLQNFLLEWLCPQTTREHAKWFQGEMDTYLQEIAHKHGIVKFEDFAKRLNTRITKWCFREWNNRLNFMKEHNHLWYQRDVWLEQQIAN
mmetsp:Transcript_13638/g.18870  ORF Transcript_13638/g.18870 Transcript_13638/m.18870 type:complete len:2438 (+) Transcript_13638:1384-8697(+)